MNPHAAQDEGANLFFLSDLLATFGGPSEKDTVVPRKDWVARKDRLGRLFLGGWVFT
jgi:hypothetical protein